MREHLALLTTALQYSNLEFTLNSDIVWFELKTAFIKQYLLRKMVWSPLYNLSPPFRPSPPFSKILEPLPLYKLAQNFLIRPF